VLERHSTGLTQAATGGVGGALTNEQGYFDHGMSPVVKTTSRCAMFSCKSNALNKPPIWSGSGKSVGLIHLLGNILL